MDWDQLKHGLALEYALKPTSHFSHLADIPSSVFYMNIIWGGAFALVMCFMPETLPSVVIARAVKKRDTHDPNAEIVAAELTKVNVFQEIRFVLTMALRIMFTEPIVIFLGFYNGFAYG